MNAERQFISHDSSARHPAAGDPRAHLTPVSKKISYLVHEGKPQKQAVAIALSMKRAGRLTESGGYRRVGS